MEISELPPSSNKENEKTISYYFANPKEIQSMPKATPTPKQTNKTGVVKIINNGVAKGINVAKNIMSHPCKTCGGKSK